jgi:crotonobetaine/carnitine-CoA ligase
MTNAFASLLESLPTSGGVAFGDSRTGTAELVSLGHRAAARLAVHGIEPGDRVAALLDNGPAFMSLWFGAAFAGARFVPVNTRLRGETLRHILSDSGAKLLVAETVLAQAARPFDSPQRRTVESQAWMDEVRGASEAAPRSGESGLIIYTSGTTGRPKGVSWTGVTQALHARSYSEELVRLAAGEASYSCLPLFHVTCMGVTLSSLIHGATAHVDPRFSLSGFWPRITETRAVFFPYVGSILSLLLKDERPATPHSVRSAMGAAAPAETFVRFQERFGVRLLETYGQTELGSIWLMNGDAAPGAIGKPCARAEARLAKVDGVEGAGELQIRPLEPHAMMSGYHGNAEATRESWQDGWYRTRDLATRGADGSYRFSGRLADCVRRRGENVSAFEVEQAVLRHPQVVEAAVVGVDSELGEQDLALYYVERAAGAAGAPGLERWCRDHLSDFMVPRYYVPVREFPKTETQRVQKGLLHSEVRLAGGYDADKKEYMG